MPNEKDSGLEDNDPLMNENLFEGDILLAKGVSPRNKLDEPVYLWPKGKVPYVISDELNWIARKEINEAIEEYHLKTCIKFVPKRKRDQDYVHFVPYQKGCFVEDIGKKLFGQKIYLDKNCQRNKGAIQHELMHALGM